MESMHEQTGVHPSLAPAASGVRDSTAIRWADELAVIGVRGDDHCTWLQGQITQSVEKLPQEAPRYGFFLTHTGKIEADAWVIASEDALHLIVPATQVRALLKRFDRYIVMEDVEVEHLDDIRILSAHGPRSHDVLPDGVSFDILGTGGALRPVSKADQTRTWELALETLRVLKGDVLSETLWHTSRVHFGRPWFGIDFGLDTLPQETGLEHLAVSFTKGCYVGQEPVIMLQHRGHPPRHMAILQRDPICPPLETTSSNAPITLYAGDQECGKLRSRDTQSGQALGLIKRKYAEPGATFREAPSRDAENSPRWTLVRRVQWSAPANRDR